MFTLILPALLREPHETLPELYTPALNQLLRYARVQPTAYSRMQLYQTYLCDQLGQPENIIYASPVWQQMGMNTASQIPAEHLPLTHSEATIWCNELNQFYHGEYLFTPIRPDLWTLALPSPPTWHAASILDLASQLDGSQSASGSDIRPWLALSTELQMWLHNHPRNAARQQNQLPPINGIWLWNAPAPAPFQAASLIASNSPKTTPHGNAPASNAKSPSRTPTSSPMTSCPASKQATSGHTKPSLPHGSKTGLNRCAKTCFQVASKGCASCANKPNAPSVASRNGRFGNANGGLTAKPCERRIRTSLHPARAHAKAA